MSTAKEVLIRARELIAEPERWTQGHSARSAFGSPTDPLWDSAVSFCVLGAVHRASGGDYDLTIAAEKILRRALRRRIIWKWNDAKCRKHGEVVSGLDRAIALAGGAS